MLDTLNDTYQCACLAGQAFTVIGDLLITMFYTPLGMVMKCNHFLSLDVSEFQNHIESTVFPF